MVNTFLHIYYTINQKLKVKKKTNLRLHYLSSVLSCFKELLIGNDIELILAIDSLIRTITYIDITVMRTRLQ